MGLIEIKDPSRCYSWSNNQDKPIMAVLDRVLVSVDWEARYPLAITMLPKGVSDHNPIRLSFGEKMQFKNQVFRLEKWWLEIGEFAKLVKRTWDIECSYSNPMEVRQFKISF
jgi:hypothetical protein